MTRSVCRSIIAMMVVFCATMTLAAKQPTAIKVACIGDSITYGHGIQDRTKNSFPAQLGAMLGGGYEVRNFGVSGATLLKKGNKPYWKLGQYKAAQKYQPDLVVIMLGTNDTKPGNWKYSRQFKPDYIEMVKTFQGLHSQPAVYICYPIPVFPQRWGINDKTVKTEVIPLVDQVAKATGAHVIDLYQPLVGKSDLVPDKVHPNAAGAKVIAQTLAAALTQGRMKNTARQQAPAFVGPPIEMGTPFADNAILQRQMPVPVWGWSQPGTKVTVAFAGQTKTATAGPDGKWMLRLDPLKANATAQNMVIGDQAGHTVTLKNILVGEVWLASGQSNMEWHAGKSSCSLIINKLNEQAQGKADRLPPIRECEVTNFYACLHPIEHAKGEWKHGNFGDYSAIAFAFAYKLYQELGVPIGILNCSFSSTTIEAWTPRIGFADGTDEYTRSVYQKILETDPATPQHKAAWSKFYQSLEDTLKENARRLRNGQPAQAVSTATPGNMHGNRDASWLFNARMNPMIPYAIRGGIWNQGYANMGGGLTYYNNLHSLIRGWRKCWGRADLPVYFHQFYCPGKRGQSNNLPSIDSTAEMRLGTWLARDIPNADMASQIDIAGAIHYRNKVVPGRRLALLALKNQYGKKIVAEGPMFKSYTVKGNTLIVAFDHAEDGLVVAETGFNATGKQPGATGFADPKIIAHGDDQVTLFYLADENRVWHQANMKIDGDKVIVSSPKVKSPRGVSYASGGVGFQPNLYNRALLPMTPFIYYDHKLVTSKTWPDKPMKIDGVKVDPATVGKVYEYRKMALLSTQFRNNAVIQAGVPVTFWGAAVHNWGYEADGQAVIKFSFAGIEKTIPVKHGMRVWQYTVPAMPASAEPKTLKVVFEIDGQVVHERICRNIVVGDVWYVSAPHAIPASGANQSGSMVRVMKRKAKRSTYPMPHRFSVATSSSRPEHNRFASLWNNADGGFAGALGQRIHAKTGKPVGIVYMEAHDPVLKSWISVDYLNQTPSLMADYKDLGKLYPGNPYYQANVKRYINAWKHYWGEYIPKMIATKRVPDGVPWGSYPSLSSASTSVASQTYNGLVCTFAPGSFKGIIFLCSRKMFEKDQGANYGPQLSVLANCWKQTFGGADPRFFYTIPNQALAAKITRPDKIQGKSTAYEIDHWLTGNEGSKQVSGLIDRVVSETYP